VYYCQPKLTNKYRGRPGNEANRQPYTGLYVHLIADHLPHPRFLHTADVVMVMEGGVIKSIGPPSAVLPQVEKQMLEEKEEEEEEEGEEDSKRKAKQNQVDTYHSPPPGPTV